MAVLEVHRGDITRLAVDAIVNAANSSLLGGGGVDGAIHRAAGMQLVEACRKLHGCRTGEAKATPGFRLPAKFVFHTVGPVWNGGSLNEEALLASCYSRCLDLARDHGVQTLAFPAISTGIYRFPVKLATEIAVRTVCAHEYTAQLERVLFVVFNDEAEQAYSALLGL
ncbi:O-acetyl-ADP-ribose deacetylase [Terriglobus tenax]|uniref:O-acetyl-ADP-ribose deacetylase n=1 Tax=Terriglobus tenax TaxID=1111115 RepID=UPI0021E0A429|nr:O-acetyl-ADP-ribose deacetylase [Terriglobus tenax]